MSFYYVLFFNLILSLYFAFAPRWHGYITIRNLRTDLGACFACAYFVKLIYCRQKIIYTSTLVEDLYYRKNPWAKCDKSFPQASIAMLKDMALEQHRVSFLSGSTEIHQWNGHSSRFAYFVSSLWQSMAPDQCRVHYFVPFI